MIFIATYSFFHSFDEETRNPLVDNGGHIAFWLTDSPNCCKKFSPTRPLVAVSVKRVAAQELFAYLSRNQLY